MARTNKGTPCNWALEIIFSVKEKKLYYESVREWTHNYKTDRQHRHTYQMRPSTHRFSRCLKSQQYRSLRVTPQNTETNKNIIKVLMASYCMGCSNFPLPGKAQMSHFHSEERYKIKMASTYLTLSHRKQNPPPNMIHILTLSHRDWSSSCPPRSQKFSLTCPMSILPTNEINTIFTGRLCKSVVKILRTFLRNENSSNTTNVLVHVLESKCYYFSSFGTCWYYNNDATRILEINAPLKFYVSVS